ncbi:MAG: phospholipase A [Muribaculaceae bacterium]|nr:phospholipase A [Muribaculaceae bacterium]
MRIYKINIVVCLISILSALLGEQKSYAQLVPVRNQREFTDSLKKELDYGPFFGLYKDTYFIVGTKVPAVPTAYNSDVKFQISFAIRLTNATLPWNSFLFLSYTQKAFWNVFQESLPMGDINFNPAIGWTKPFFNQGRYVGKLSLILEHESNGRDGEASRSWNRVSVSGMAMIDAWLMVHAKFWIPIIDGENNKDITKYCGIYQSGVVLTTPNKKFTFGVTWVKRGNFKLDFNTIWEVSWLISKKTNINLFAQYYNGYGEDLLHYNQFRSMLRVGLVFKPKFFSEF